MNISIVLVLKQMFRSISLNFILNTNKTIKKTLQIILELNTNKISWFLTLHNSYTILCRYIKKLSVNHNGT